MDMINAIFSSGFTYIIIFQILIITGLILLFLWTWYQKMLARIETAYAEAATQPPPSHPQEVNPTDNKNEARGEKASNDGNRFEEEKKIYEDKIQFLESRVLEFEVLQEEMNTLKDVKEENEKLKSEIIELTKKLESSKPSSPSSPSQPEAA